MAGPCVSENRKIIPKLKFTVEEDSVPLWKKRKQNQECDVLSVLDLKDEELSLKTQIRKDFYDRLIAQVHLGRCWEDLFLLRSLLRNPHFNIKQCGNSYDKLQNTAQECHDKLSRRLRMLYCRQPIYTYRKMKFPSPDSALKHMQRLVFFMQYDNRRHAFDHLDTIKSLRKQGKVNELAIFTEKILSNFYMALTYKTFPRKFEFVTELCHLLGLTYLQELKVPHDIINHELSERMFLLFAMPPVVDKLLEKKYIFGVKSTWNDPLKVDTSFLKYK